MGVTSDTRAILNRSALFAGVSDATMAKIAALATRVEFEEGDNIYALGDDARQMFIVDRGRVRFSIGVGNRAGPGSVMSAGDVFGWAALLDNSPRRVATASCLEDTTVLAIDGQGMLRLFEADTQGGFVVMRRLAETISRDLMSVLAT